jgi:hypothetical protein
MNRPAAKAVAIVLAAILGLLAPARAATTRTRQQRGNQATSKPTVPIPNVDTQALQQAQDQLKSARIEFTKADAALSSTVARLHGEFEASAVMTEALAALKAAEAQYAAASRPVLAAVARQALINREHGGH